MHQTPQRFFDRAARAQRESRRGEEECQALYFLFFQLSESSTFGVVAVVLFLLLVESKVYYTGRSRFCHFVFHSSHLTPLSIVTPKTVGAFWIHSGLLVCIFAALLNSAAAASTLHRTAPAHECIEAF